jgi:hypothetical protein
MRKVLVLTLLLGAVWIVLQEGFDVDSGYLERQMRLKSDSINERVNRKVNAPV